MVSSSTTAAEVEQMEHRTDQHISKGSPEVALLAFAFLAAFAYLLF
jgi:hypothetical protein